MNRHPTTSLLFLLIILFLFTACAPSAPRALRSTASVPTKADSASLRSLAEKRGFSIGAAVQAGLIANEPLYRETLRREFNLVTAEQEMKMCVVWPERSRWDFTAADAIVQFAREKGMKVRGHTLIWIDCVPDWLVKGSFTTEEAKAILKEYITTVVGRYKGKIYAWDVLNEAVERGTIWDGLIGYDYARLAFQWAHEADPQALLFYNDFNIETPGSKFDAVYSLIKSLKEQGVPIDGVGFQAHLKSPIPPEGLAANFKKLAEIGVQAQITEFDLPIDHTAQDPLAGQAKAYGDMLRTCLSASNCTAFVMWGFTDAHTWLVDPRNDPDPQPLIFDNSYQRKSAYDALYQALLK